MDTDLDLIHLRLKALEQQNRRLRAALCVLTIPILGILWMASLRWQGETAPPPGGSTPEVHAQRFVLLDSAGKERAVLGMGASGPFLHFLPAAESPSAAEPALVPVSLDSSGLVFSGPAGTGMAANAEGIEIASTSGRAYLKAQSLELKPAQSAAVVTLRLAPAGPTLLLQDAGGSLASIGVHSLSPAASAVAQRTGAASIVLVAPDHRILWSAPAAAHH